MAWEKRGKTCYYYRKKRDGDHVTSEYLGKSLAAQRISELAGRERRKRLLAQTELQQQASDMQKMDADLECFTELVRRLAEATLLTSGYHPHKGQWRRKRYV